jgi:endonuclease/exonuclease/phosphatase family metal-dependent hydrolase
MRQLLIIIAFSLLIVSQSHGASDAKSAAPQLRIATFNIAMGLEQSGQLGKALARDDDRRLNQVAEILQTVRPDVVLLNEFDYDPAVDAAGLLNANYLAQPHNGQQPIQYPFHFRAPVNSGQDSGVDIDGDGKTGEPGDAWGFGLFPGQYGMLVLSRFPIDLASSRTFQHFRWASLPGARRPVNSDGTPFHPDSTWQALRLSSKSHWDLVIKSDVGDLHLLAHHPTPPVFDGPEDRNGLRNFDENRFWLNYTQPDEALTIVDDEGRIGGIHDAASFVIAGDFNADPSDGDSVPGSISQLLDAPWINADCVPASTGASESSQQQGAINRQHQGDPAADTADFNDQYTGNLRLDYLLPSTSLTVIDCGVFWPAEDEAQHSLTDASDHRLVWLDISQ